jgi:hypothetical protein
VEPSSRDKFGLRVKLPDGNIASRVPGLKIFDFGFSPM